MNSACVIGIAGGSGGVGASVLCAAIGIRAAAAGRLTVCVDGDRLGGGLDVTFGLEQQHGLRWSDLSGARGQIDGCALRQRLPAVDGTSLLSFDRMDDADPTPEAITEVITALAREVELVVIDLPRPDHPLFEPFAAGLDAVVLLTGSGARDLAGVSAVAPHLDAVCPQVWLCVRPGRNGPELVETVCAALDLPLLCTVQEDAGLDASLVHGIPPGSSARGALAAAADLVLAQLLLPTSAAS